MAAFPDLPARLWNWGFRGRRLNRKSEAWELTSTGRKAKSPNRGRHAGLNCLATFDHPDHPAGVKSVPGEFTGIKSQGDAGNTLLGSIDSRRGAGAGRQAGFRQAMLGVPWGRWARNGTRPEPREIPSGAFAIAR